LLAFSNISQQWKRIFKRFYPEKITVLYLLQEIYLSTAEKDAESASRKQEWLNVRENISQQQLTENCTANEFRNQK